MIARPNRSRARRDFRIWRVDFNIDGEDANGLEIDLRPTPEEIAAVGAPPPAKAAAPRYDPETGELIRPLELSNRPVAHAQSSEIPFAQPAVTYSTSPQLPAESWRGPCACSACPSMSW